MITFSSDDGFGLRFYHLHEDSSLVVPLPTDGTCDYGTDNHNFYGAMHVCRDNGIPIKVVEISGKHLQWFALWAADFPTPNNYAFHDKPVYYTGDMANFIIYNYANWLVV